jgi:hypothetical protein
MKKLCAILVALILAGGCGDGGDSGGAGPVYPPPENPPRELAVWRSWNASATPDDSVRAELWTDGKMIISGRGKMADIDLNGGQSARKWMDNFRVYDSIKSVDVREGITYIGKYAFYGAPYIASVVIAGSVDTIGPPMFNAYFVDTIAIVCRAAVPPAAGTVYGAGPGDDRIGKVTLYVPAESIDLYRAAEGWNKFLNVEAIRAD